MGPGDGIQIQRLMDLPTTLETAEQQPSPSAAVAAGLQQARAKSLLPQPGQGKLSEI